MGPKLLLSSLVALIALAPVAAAKAPPQKVTGQVIVPTPHPQDPTMCFQGIARRVNIVTQGAYTGPFTGFIFDIEPSTIGGKFKLDVTGGSGQEDLDIFFASSFGKFEEDPSMNSPTFTGEFTTEKAGGEAGVVPPTSTKAVICLKGAPRADFEYVAKPPKKKA